VLLPLCRAEGSLTVDTGPQCGEVMRRERGVNPLLPAFGELNRRRVRQTRMLQAGPGPLPAAFHQAGSDRIVEDIPEHGEEMAVLLNGETFEATLPDMAMAVVVPMIAAHMTGQPPLHERTERRLGGRLQHQMKMIGHHTEAKDLDGKLGLGRGEQVQEGAIVPVFVEDKSAPIAAIEDMVGVASTQTAGNARHGRETVRQKQNRVQAKSSLSYPRFRGHGRMGTA